MAAPSTIEEELRKELDNVKNMIENVYKKEIVNLKLKLEEKQINEQENQRVFKEEIFALKSKFISDNLDNIKNLEVKHNKEIDDKRIKYKE